MSFPQGWVELHDGNSSKKRHPEGRPVAVRLDSIVSLRGYDEGRVRCVVGYNGSWLHVTETYEHIASLLAQGV